MFFFLCASLVVVLPLADALAHASRGPLQLVDLAGQDGLAQVEHWCSGAYDSEARHRDGLQALFNKEAGSSAAGPQLQQLDQRLAALRSSLVQQRAALDAAQWSARAHVADTELAVQDGTKDLKALRAVATRLTDAGMKVAGSALSQLMSQADLQQGRNEEEIRQAQKVLKETSGQAQAVAQIEAQYNSTRLIKEKLMSRQLSAQKSQGVLSAALAAAHDYLNDIQDICNKGKQARAEMESTVLPALRQVAAKSPPPEAAASVPPQADVQAVPPMPSADSDVASSQPDSFHKVASLAVMSKPSVKSSAMFSRLTSGMDNDEDDSPPPKRASLGKANTDSSAPSRKKFQMESDWDDDDDKPAKKQSAKKHLYYGDDGDSPAGRLNSEWDDDDDVPLKKQSGGRKSASRLLQGMDEPDILPPEHAAQKNTMTTAKTTTSTTTPIAAVARLQAAFDSDAPDNVTVTDPTAIGSSLSSKKDNVDASSSKETTTTMSAIEKAIYEAATETTTSGPASSPGTYDVSSLTSGSTSTGSPGSSDVSSFSFGADIKPFSFSAAATTTTVTTTSTATFAAEGSQPAVSASFDEVSEDFDEFDGESLVEVGSNLGKNQLRRSGAKDTPTISSIVLGGYSDVLKNKALRQLADNNPSLEKLQGLEDHLSKSNPTTSDSSPQAQTNRWCTQQGSGGLSGPAAGASSALDAAEVSLAESKASKKAVGLEVKTLKKVQESIQQDVQGLSALQAWVQQEGTALNSRLETWESQASQDASAISSAAKASAAAHGALIDAISKAQSKRNSAFQAQQATLSHAMSEEANAEQLLSQAVERRNQAVAAADQARKTYKSSQANCDNAHVAMELKKRHMKMKLRAMSVAIAALSAK